jgi:hypothetical protein
MSYIVHKDVQKEVDIPPLNNNMEFNKQQVQDDPDVLLDITV